jgi:hypothetical protein
VRHKNTFNEPRVPDKQHAFSGKDGFANQHLDTKANNETRAASARRASNDLQMKGNSCGLGKFFAT